MDTVIVSASVYSGVATRGKKKHKQQHKEKKEAKDHQVNARGGEEGFAYLGQQTHTHSHAEPPTQNIIRVVPPPPLCFDNIILPPECSPFGFSCYWFWW